MDTGTKGAAKRLILSLAAASLSGCVYAPPPYAAYDASGSAPVAASPYYYPYSYGYPTYVGPPLSLSFGFYEHRYGGGYRGGWGGGRRGYGWGGRGGYRGGWGGRH